MLTAKDELPWNGYVRYSTLYVGEVYVIYLEKVIDPNTLSSCFLLPWDRPQPYARAHVALTNKMDYILSCDNENTAVDIERLLEENGYSKSDVNWNVIKNLNKKIIGNLQETENKCKNEILERELFF